MRRPGKQWGEWLAGQRDTSRHRRGPCSPCQQIFTFWRNLILSFLSVMLVLSALVWCLPSRVLLWAKQGMAWGYFETIWKQREHVFSSIFLHTFPCPQETAWKGKRKQQKLSPSLTYTKIAKTTIYIFVPKSTKYSNVYHFVLNVGRRTKVKQCFQKKSL